LIYFWYNKYDFYIFPDDIPNVGIGGVDDNAEEDIPY
jgi:hypothetical protein